MEENNTHEVTQTDEQQASEVEELRAKLAEANERIQKMEETHHREKLKHFVKSLRPSNEIYEEYITNQLISSGLKFEGDELVGSDEIISALREKCPDAFAANPYERAAAPTSQNSTIGIERRLRGAGNAFERGFQASATFPPQDAPSKNTEW